MDDTEEEKIQLLESIRLQDAALSALTNEELRIISDSDDDDDDDDDQQNQPVPSHDNVNINTEDVAVQQVESQPSWAEALEANQEYDSVLEQLETEIKQDMVKIEKKIKELQSKISSTSKDSSNCNTKGHWVYVFGMPYFKTANFFPCPNNEDYFSKKRNNEICWSDLPSFHQWVTRHKRVLYQAVKQLALEKCRKEAQLQLTVLQKDLETAKEAGEPLQAGKIEEIVESFDVEAVAKSKVDSEIANGNHDWMQISARFLEGKQSPESCQSFWYLYLHPKINKTPFTEEEEKKLIEIAEEYNHQDWDSIAESLGTNRSGYQCFIVYQNKLNVVLRRNMWDVKEDKQLVEVVEKCRMGDYIPWGKVAYYMEGRTKTQVFNRWSYSVNPAIRKGRFTQEEDILILVGVQMWGEDFQRISIFLKDRTTCQVRDRYRHYLGRASQGIPWTIEDDKLLLELSKEHGRSWVKIAQHFPTKDRTQVRHRFTTLTKWKAKNPDSDLTEAPSRCYNPAIFKDFQNQWEKARAILNCETVEEMVKAKNTLISCIVKRKMAKLDAGKKKKPTIVETDLLNYFRCSYDVPGGHRKVRLQMGEAQKYAEELFLTLRLLNAKFKFPTKDQIKHDTSISHLDKDILVALRSKMDESPELFNPGLSADSDKSDDNLFTDHPDSPLFFDVGSASPLLQAKPAVNIDYIPKSDINSVYIGLPLMNFDGDEIVADKNPDPSFFHPAVPSDYVVSEIPKPETQVRDLTMFPPNLTTLVGMRTFLLNRRNLVTCRMQTTRQVVDLEPTEKFMEAKKKFLDRILSLFLWPAMMSRYGPSSNTAIFLDEGNTDISSGRKRKSGFPKRVKNPAHFSFERNENILSNVRESLKDVEEGLFTTNHNVLSSPGPPKKRRKVVVESENDPDDPDPL